MKKICGYSFLGFVIFLIGFSIGKMFPDMQSTHLLDRSAMYQSKDKNYTLSLPPEDSDNGFLLSITEPTKAYNLMGEYKRVSESLGILTVETGEKMYLISRYKETGTYAF